VHVRKVANPKHLKMVALEGHVRSCWGITVPMIVKLI